MLLKGEALHSGLVIIFICFHHENIEQAAGELHSVYPIFSKKSEIKHF